MFTLGGKYHFHQFQSHYWRLFMNKEHKKGFMAAYDGLWLLVHNGCSVLRVLDVWRELDTVQQVSLAVSLSHWPTTLLQLKKNLQQLIKDFAQTIDHHYKRVLLLQAMSHIIACVFPKDQSLRWFLRSAAFYSWLCFGEIQGKLLLFVFWLFL